MRMRIALFLVVLGLGLGVALAQEKTTKPATGKDAGKAAPAATKKAAPPDMTAKQSAEMAKLTKMFTGAWAADLKFEAVPEMGPTAQAGTGKGREVTRAGPAGNSLVSDFKARSTSGPFSGHGVIWWDAKAGAYRSVWCDSESPGGCDSTATGKWEGDNLVFTADAEFPGPDQKMMKMSMRQVYAEMKPGSFTFYIDSSIAGAPMKRMMTIEYSKQGPKAAPVAEKTP